MRKKRKTVDGVTAGFLGLAVLISIRIVGYCMPYESQELHYSVEDSFSGENITLELSAFMRSEIYYTLDGSEPDRDALLYEEPILLEAGFLRKGCGPEILHGCRFRMDQRGVLRL